MKHKSRGAGKGVGGVRGWSGGGSEGLGRVEIVRIRGKMEEKGDIIALTVMELVIPIISDRDYTNGSQKEMERGS